MFRTRLHPTSVGLAGGIVLIALWALLWAWFLSGMVRGAPEKRARQPGATPELARVIERGGHYRSTEPL